MNTKLATTMVIGALLVPMAGYAAEKSMTQSTKEAISDSVITTKIKADYAKDKTVSTMRIHVNTDDKGVVTLTGTAKSKVESDQAEKIARETKGVTSVKNNITIDGSGGKSTTASVNENVGDATITSKIKAAFVADRWVLSRNMHVNTDDKGVVTLTGTAQNKAESDQAEKIARETKGVTSVINNIVVASAGRTTATTSTAPPQTTADTATKKSMTQSVKENVGDATITTKIKAEYAKDKQVSAMKVHVDTDHKGMVTLSGKAKSKAESDQAEKLARETKGVVSVKNDIVVQTN